MSKELSPLEIINIKLKDKNNKYDRRVVNCNGEYLYLIKEEELDIIETALKDYENTKARLDDTQTLVWEIKKKDDALAIIVNKDVDVALLKGILHADKSLHTASYYNSHFVATYRHLTQEEYDLLKEILL